MPPPTVVMGSNWDANKNHQKPKVGGWNEAGEVQRLALEGCQLLFINRGEIKSRSFSVLGMSSFYKSLYYLTDRVGYAAQPWTATVTKGIHQMKVKGEWYMPHITIATPDGTAHFWLAIGQPVQVINNGPGTIVLPQTNITPQAFFKSDSAYYQYRVAQISLSEEGPFFPYQVKVDVWSPQGFLTRFCPK